MNILEARTNLAKGKKHPTLFTTEHSFVTPSKKVNDYLKLVHDQINKAQSGGVAVGRNIHQRSLKDAIKLVDALGTIIYDNESLTKAQKIYKKS
jgi:hypothetical protein